MRRHRQRKRSNAFVFFGFNMKRGETFIACVRTSSRLICMNSISLIKKEIKAKSKITKERKRKRVRESERERKNWNLKLNVNLLFFTNMLFAFRISLIEVRNVYESNTYFLITILYFICLFSKKKKISWLRESVTLFRVLTEFQIIYFAMVWALRSTSSIFLFLNLFIFN